MTRRSAPFLVGVFALLTTLTACGGGSAPPPEPGTSTGFAPNLDGRRVILLPVQQNLGVPGDPSAELSYALTDRGRDVDWILWSEVDEALALLDRAAEASPESDSPLRAKAELLTALGAAADTERALEALLDVNPYDGSAAASLAALRRERGVSDDRTEELERRAARFSRTGKESDDVDSAGADAAS